VPTNLKRLTLREQADKALRQMVASHRFSPGKWINVERLAKDLGVSRTPVWQAMMDMEKEGLVEHIPKQGIRMAEMTLRWPATCTRSEGYWRD
jgi:DNA-binding GntR family transcriptional regulator